MRRLVPALVSMLAALLCFAIGASAAGTRWISPRRNPFSGNHRDARATWSHPTLRERVLARSSVPRRCRREGG